MLSCFKSRIGSFLNAEEIDAATVEDNVKNEKNAVEIEEATFAWTKTTKKNSDEATELLKEADTDSKDKQTFGKAQSKDDNDAKNVRCHRTLFVVKKKINRDVDSNRRKSFLQCRFFSYAMTVVSSFIRRPTNTHSGAMGYSRPVLHWLLSSSGFSFSRLQRCN